MRDPITLLATIGADADLIGASASDLGKWLESAESALALRSAVLACDVQTLRGLLRAPDFVCCLIDPAEEEDDEEGEEDVEEEDDEDGVDSARQPKPRGSPL